MFACAKQSAAAKSAAKIQLKFEIHKLNFNYTTAQNTPKNPKRKISLICLIREQKEKIFAYMQKIFVPLCSKIRKYPKMRK
jgi:hypothetical protein